jgi:ribosomal protein L37AE/L43A
MSNFLVTGTSPDDYEQEDYIRTHECPTCNQPFREDKGLAVGLRWFCSSACAESYKDPATQANYAFVLSDGKKSTLQIFTLDGQTFEFEVTHPDMLLQSLQRAVKFEQQEKMDNALLVKPQPKGRRVQNYDGRIWDV